VKTPERSAALARALASEADGLPEDFAARVAALADAERTGWRFSRNDAGLLGAFAAMIGVCVTGWKWFGTQEPGGAEWLGPLVDALSYDPWLIIGVAGVAIVQGLTFRRRATP